MKDLKIPVRMVALKPLHDFFRPVSYEKFVNFLAYLSQFFPQALLAGFSFRTGEHKAFAVRKIAAKPEKVPILHKNVLGNVPGNVLGNVPGPFFGKKCENPRYFFFLTF